MSEDTAILITIILATVALLALLLWFITTPMGMIIVGATVGGIGIGIGFRWWSRRTK